MPLNVTGGALEFDAIINGSQFQAQITAIENSLKGLTVSAQQEANAIESVVKNATGALAAYASFATATNLLSDIVKVRGEFQQLEVAFSTILKSKERADTLMAEVVQLAATTPFTLSDVGAGAKQLLAYGTQAENITSTLTTLGNVAAGVGAPLNDIIYLYGTLQTQGRAYTRDIIQFSQRGIPIYDELAKVLGVSKEQVNGLVEAGKVGFPQIEQAFKNLTGSGGVFFNLMEKQSHTLTGELSNLQDAFSRMLNDIGKSNEGILGGGIEGLTSLINNYKQVLTIIETLVVAYGSYRAAIIAQNALNLASANIVQVYNVATRSLSVSLTLQATAASIAQRATSFLNATILANPAALAVAGITLLIGTLTFLRDKSLETKTAVELLNEAQKNSVDTYSKQEAEIRNYVSILNDQNIAESTRLDAYNKLKEISPKIVEGLSFQAAETTNLTDRTNAYIASLKQSILLESKRQAYSDAIKQRDEKFAKAKPFIGADGKANDGGFFDVLNPFSNSDVQQSEGEKKIKAYKESADVVVEIQKEISLSIGGTKDAYEFQIKALTDQNKVLDKSSKAYNDNQLQIDSLKKSLQGLAGTPVKGLSDFLKDNLNLVGNYSKYIGLAKNKADLSSVQKALTEQMESLAPGDKAKDAYKKKINDVNDLIANYGIKTAGAKAKEQSSIEDKTNQLLEQRKSLLEEINNVQRDAKQTGLIKEASIIDGINQKYDNLLQKVKDFNDKVEATNKVKGTNAQSIGLAAIKAINDARNLEVSNEHQKEDADRYKQSTEEKKKIFDDFQAYQLQVGKDHANEVFFKQTQGFQSYVDFLKNELAKLSVDDSVGGGLKKDYLTKAITTATGDQTKKQLEDQAKVYQNLFTLTTTYEESRLALDEKYGKLRGALMSLETTLTAEEYAKRNKALSDSKEAELQVLNDSLITQSALYKKMGESILLLSRQQIQDRIKILKDTLKAGYFTDSKGSQQVITPQIEEDFDAAIKKLEDFQNKTRKVLGFNAEQLSKMATEANAISGAFNDMAEALRPVNSGLADVLSQLSSSSALASNVASGLASFASGDYAGAAKSGVDGIKNIIGIFATAKQTATEAAKTLQEFNNKLLQGELDITAQYRERERQQVSLNKLRLQGLQDEQKLLDEQKKAVNDQYQAVFQKLQGEQFIASLSTSKSKNVGLAATGIAGAIASLFGAGAKTKVNEDLQSLLGKSYEDIEKLFTSGQLTQKASDLFKQLQALKKEGADVDALIEQAKEKAAQIFTGTTAQSLADSIKDGLKQGYRSVQDFADNMEDLFRNAILSGFEAQVIEKQMQEFYDQFAKDAQSNGGLDASEVAALKNLYETKLQDILNQFSQIEQVTGQSFASGGAQANSLAGAIKGITEQTAEVLSGRLGGIQVAAIETLAVSKTSLDVHLRIEANTAAAVIELANHSSFWRDVTSGAKKIHVV